MTPSKPNDGGREEGPSEEGGTELVFQLKLEGSRELRASVGPLQVYAYHDYPRHPWRSPLYIGARFGELRASTVLMPESRLRPFSGGRR